MERILKPIREKRFFYENRIEEVYEILKEGSKKAERKANETLNEVKSAMKVNYFEDKELMKQHINKYKK